MTTRTTILRAAATLAIFVSSVSAYADEPDINWSNLPGSKCAKALTNGTLRVRGARAENTNSSNSLRVSCPVDRQNILGELGSGSHVWVIDDHPTLPVTCDLVVRRANDDTERSRQTLSTPAGRDSSSPIRLNFGAAAASTNDVFVISCLIPPNVGGISSVVGARVVEVAQPAIQSCPSTFSAPSVLTTIDPLPLLDGAATVCSQLTGNAPCDLHHLYTPPLAREREPLFVFLPGSNMEPRWHDQVLETAASTGYRAIGLSYDTRTKAVDACPAGTSCATNCKGDFRAEVITGIDSSTGVAVAVGDSILERLYRLLEHLHATDSNGGWLSYHVPTTGQIGYANIVWGNIILGGFSQGAGHAALISKEQAVHGLFVLDGANDTCTDPISSTTVPSNWMTAADASDGRPKFGFRHDHGTGATTNTETWQALGLGTSLFSVDCTGGFPCGAPGVLDAVPPPPASVTDHGVPGPPGGFCTEHRSMARDECMPTDLAGAGPAVATQDYRLFQPYALRMCHACDSATCP